MIDLDYLRATNVLRLQAAARKAGLAFKNGSVDKAGLIARLSNHPAIAGATVAILKREDAQSPVEYKTGPKADPSDWLDDDDIPVRPVSPPPVNPAEDGGTVVSTAQTPSSESFGDWRPAVQGVAQAVQDLSARVSREGTDLRNRVDFLETRATAQAEATGRLAQRLTDLESARPIEVKIGEKPPIRIEGKTHRQFPDLLAWLSAIGRVILTGPAGTGKSRAASQCAEAFGLEFHLQTPFTQSYEYLGHRDAQGVFHETPTFKAYTRGGFLLMDEADSSAPDAFLAANPILDGNGFAMFGDGQLHKQHPDFRVILNMNTQGDGASLSYSGRNPLDGATIARFGGMLHWEVDPNLEASMAQGEGQFYKAVLAVRSLMQQRGILTVNATPRHVLIGASLLRTEHFAKRREFILSATLKNGAVAEVWPDVLRLPDVQTFLRG